MLDEADVVPYVDGDVRGATVGWWILEADNSGVFSSVTEVGEGGEAEDGVAGGGVEERTHVCGAGLGEERVAECRAEET